MQKENYDFFVYIFMVMIIKIQMTSVGESSINGQLAVQ